MNPRLIILALVSACSVQEPPLPTKTPAPRSLDDTTHLRVRVLDGTIVSARPDGRPWNTTRPGKTWTVIGAATGLLAGQAALGAKVGGWLDGSERSYPPAPLVELSAGGRRLATAAVAPTFTPTWDQVMLISTTQMRNDDEIVLAVRDGVTGEVVGSTKMSFADLKSRPRRTIATIPNVPTLNVAVDMVRVEPGYWTGVFPASSGTVLRVRGGERVHFSAEGQLCTPSEGCFSAQGNQRQIEILPSQRLAFEGSRASPEYENARASVFKDLPHLALVAMFVDEQQNPGAPVVVGQGASFLVPRDGRIRLLVNDVDARRTSGRLYVAVSTGDPELGSR